jgi:predicted metal-dependent peptidase
MNAIAQKCAYPKGCTKQTKDPSGRCHLHRDGDGAAGGKIGGPAGLAGSTGNMVAQTQQQQKRAKGGPTTKLTAEEKEYYENMKVGASFRAPYFRRSIAKFPVASYPGLGTFAMGKNGIVYIDFDWAKAGGIEKASAILIHEASHFNLDHFGRSDMVSKNPAHSKLMNIAGDMEINQGLVSRQHKSTNVDWRRSILQDEYAAVYPWSDQFKFDPDQPFEVYFRQLIKKQQEEQDKQDQNKDDDCEQCEQEKQQGGGGQDQQDQDGDGQGDQGQSGQDQGDQQGGQGGGGGEPGDQDGEGGGQGGMGGQSADPNGKPCGHGKGGQPGDGEPSMCGGGSAIGNAIEGELTSEADGAMSEVDVENLRRDTARDIMEHEKANGRGSVPGELVRNAEEILKGTRVDWRREMRAAVSKSVRTVRGRKQYDTKQSNRRMANATKFIFPGTVTPTPNISIAVDTSGSMGQTELGLALGQIQSILNQAGSKSRVDFIAVDAHSTEPSELKKLSDVKLKGGGGTDMGVAVKSFDERKRNRPDLGIIVTDGGTPWPDEKPKGMDIIIAIVGQGASAEEYRGMPVPDWAKTVYINQVG